MQELGRAGTVSHRAGAASFGARSRRSWSSSALMVQGADAGFQQSLLANLQALRSEHMHAGAQAKAAEEELGKAIATWSARHGVGALGAVPLPLSPQQPMGFQTLVAHGGFEWVDCVPPADRMAERALSDPYRQEFRFRETLRQSWLDRHKTLEAYQLAAQAAPPGRALTSCFYAGFCVCSARPLRYFVAAFSDVLMRTLRPGTAQRLVYGALVVSIAGGEPCAHWWVVAHGNLNTRRFILLKLQSVSSQSCRADGAPALGLTPLEAVAPLRFLNMWAPSAICLSMLARGA